MEMWLFIEKYTYICLVGKIKIKANLRVFPLPWLLSSDFQLPPNQSWVELSQYCTHQS